jgi:VIT1/CCC1 family predicted Fe2+/Mn2+ transporter
MSSVSTNHTIHKPYQAYTDIVIGISDGLIIPFAVTTGFSVIATGNETVVQAGAIVIAAGAMFMGLAGFFAAKNRQEHLAQRTAEEEEKIKKEELEKTLHLFKQLDLGKDMQDQAASVIENDSKEWKAYLQEHLPELHITENAHLPKTAFIIALSYAAGGFIPLLPYLIINDKVIAFLYSAVISITTLLIFGYIKSKVNREPLLWGTLRLMLLGTAAAGAAFAVAKIFVP